MKREIKFFFQRTFRGWSDDECWNLNYEFFKWVNSRFKKYKEQAEKVIDLEYYKLTYKKKKYTQLQIIDRIIELTDWFIENDYYELIWSNPDKVKETQNEIFDLFKLVFDLMWW